MGKDNKDRYGYRHRKDGSYEPSEAMPGDVGDSKGTFHDRAGSDNTVIVDGEAISYESHRRKKSESGSLADRTRTGVKLKGMTRSSKGNSRSRKKNARTSSSKSTGGTLGELDGETVEVTVDRISGSGNAIAEYQGYHVHVEGGEPGDTYEVELTAASSYWTGRPKVKE